MKIVKYFARPKQQAALKELILPTPNPPPTRKYLTTSLEQTFSHGDIQKRTNIFFQSASRMWFLGVKKWCSANVFSGIKQKNIC